MPRIGWNATPESKDPGDWTIKAVDVPAGTWYMSLPIRVRWGGEGPQGVNSGISIFWKAWEDYDPPQEPPVEFAFSDHIDIEAGHPGDADCVFPLGCGIITSEDITLYAMIRTTGTNVATVVDGDGLMWAG